MKNNLKVSIYTALLTALAIVIPTAFGFLRVIIPPFSATIASHVPMFISMFISPWSALVVGIGSFLGFIFTGLPIVVACRALMHALVGFIGAVLLKKKCPFMIMVLITSIIHGGLEALVVVPFGFKAFDALVVVGVGSVIHHIIDGAISAVVIKSISKVVHLKTVSDAKV